MATTTNNTMKLSDIESVFASYDSYVDSLIQKRVDEVNRAIKSVNIGLTTFTDALNTTRKGIKSNPVSACIDFSIEDTKKLLESAKQHLIDIKNNANPQLLEDIIHSLVNEIETMTAEYDKLKNKNVTRFGKDKKEAHFRSLEVLEATLEENKNFLQMLQSGDISALEKTQNAKKRLLARLRKYKKELPKTTKNYDEQVKRIDALIESLKNSKDDIDKQNLLKLALSRSKDAQKIETANTNELIKLLERQIRIENATLQANKSLTRLNSELEALPNNPENCSYESFVKFLEDNNLSTIHAEELYKLYTDRNSKITLKTDSFQLRKQHPVRDYLLKKVLTPALITGTGVAAITGGIASSGLAAGAKFMGVTITSSPMVNFVSTAIPGFVIGVAGTAAFITAKDLATKAYYRIRYGNGKTILKDFEDENTITKFIEDKQTVEAMEKDGLKEPQLYKLMRLIKDTKSDILDLRQGSNNIFSKAFRGIQRTFKNIVNRNRVHRLEATTKQLVEMYEDINDQTDLEPEVKKAQLKPIRDVLKEISDFITKDINQSKVHALLTCKESKPGHTHKEVIENLDIYAKLAIYLNSVIKEENAEVSHRNTAKERKAANKHTKDLRQQNLVAAQLLNPEREEDVIAGRLFRKFENLEHRAAARRIDEDRTITNYMVIEGKLRISFSDIRKSRYYNVDNAINIDSVELSPRNQDLIIIKYNDANKKTININDNIRIKELDSVEKATIAARLDDENFLSKLEMSGFAVDRINAFKKDFKKSKATNFYRSEACLRNSDYSKILDACLNIIQSEATYTA